MRAWAGPLLVMALLTEVLTYPMAPRAAAVGPVNTGDGQWSIWSTCWVARALVADPLHLYDANIFSPRRGTLAYSEANIAGGVLAVPAWWATRNPYLAYNTAILLAFFLSASAAFALARLLVEQGSSLVLLGQDSSLAKAAEQRVLVGQSSSFALPVAIPLIAAIGFAFAPVVVVRLAHIQLLMTFGLPLTLLAFHRFVERQTAVRTVALAAALVLSALCSGYYGIAAGIAVGLGFVYYAASRGLWCQPRYLAACAIVVVLAALLVLPFFVPYLQLETGGSAFRSIDETRRYSADWRSYLTSTAHVQRGLLEWVVPFDRSAFPERVLFPGFLLSALALVAIAVSWRSASSRPGPEAASTDSARETVGFYALLAFIGAWLSFGPAAGLYRLAYELVPGFSLTRAPARLGILVVLALAVLASLGMAEVMRRVHAGGAPRRWRLVPLVACLCLAAELAAVPLDLRPALPMPAAHRALATLPPGAVAEFPYFYLERDLYRNSLYMLYSTAHWHPLVNGYSDFTPQGYRETVVAISTFPSREAFRLLRDRGARYAIFHLNLYDRRSREKLLDAIGRYKDRLRPLSQADDTLLFEIVPWPE